MFLLNVLPALQTFAATCSGNVKFLGLIPWYAFLNVQNVKVPNPSGGTVTICQVQAFMPNANGGQPQLLGAHSPVLLIGLAILDDLIRIAALVAVGYVIAGGIQYVTSQGAPDATTRAQHSIINALIGVVIAILAASIVTFIGSKLGGIN